MSIQKRPAGGNRGVDEDKIHWEEDLKPLTRLPREPRHDARQRAPAWIPGLVALSAILLACSFVYTAVQRNLPATDQLIASLRATPTRVIATQVPTDVVRPTATRYIAPTETPIPSPVPKAGAPIAGALTIGGYAKVDSGNVGARFRKAASVSGEQIGLLKEGGVFEILEGPVAAENYKWWKLKNSDGTIGWTIEGNLNPASKP